MQAQAARDTMIGRVALTAALLAGAFSASAARAEGKPVVRPGKLQAVTPAARCANYGEGFVPVVGSDSCVKIGGRLRIDLGGAVATPVYSGSRDGIAPAAHLRLGR